MSALRRALKGDLKKQHKRAVGLGVEVSITGSNHVRWVAPSGDRHITGLTPRGQSSLRKITAFLDRVEANQGTRA